jgi:hypothetical protein
LAEVLEYALVFLASTLVVSFSVGFYASYSSVVATAEDRAVFSSLVTVAMSSIEHGGSSVTISLSDATVACHGGVLSFTTRSYSAKASLPADCSFLDANITGTHTLTFSTSAGSVGMEVG